MTFLYANKKNTLNKYNTSQNKVQKIGFTTNASKIQDGESISTYIHMQYAYNWMENMNITLFFICEVKLDHRDGGYYKLITNS